MQQNLQLLIFPPPHSRNAAGGEECLQGHLGFLGGHQLKKHPVIASKDSKNVGADIFHILKIQNNYEKR